jgi:glycerate kinase
MNQPRPLRVVVAPDSFKGSLSALEAAAAMARGVRAAFPSAEVVEVPIADGGEGTAAALMRATGGQLREQTVAGPLGDPVRATWGLLGDGRTAVIEMASGSGLLLVPSERRDPARASSQGTGELIRAALDAGVRRLVVAIGGSATNDGGCGALQALGARFLDSAGLPLPPGGAALARLARVDLAALDARLAACELSVACDVDNPLTGPRGASAIFGPQKGATPAMVALLDEALERFAAVARQATGRDVAQTPGAGAAGGMGAGLLFFTPAQLRRGVELVLDVVRFEDRLQGADLVITGEGRTDGQTSMGKAPVGVAAVAKRAGVPVVCLSGGLGPGAEAVLEQGIDALASASPGPMALEEAMERASELVELAAVRVCRLLRLGHALRG